MSSRNPSPLVVRRLVVTLASALLVAMLAGIGTVIAAQPGTVTVGAPTSVSVAPGDTAVFGNVSISKNGNNNVCTLTLSASGLPSGAAPVFGTNPLTMTTVAVSTSLSITTTLAVAPGSYPFTVSAVPSGDCQGPPDPLPSQTLTLTITGVTPTPTPTPTPDPTPTPTPDPTPTPTPDPTPTPTPDPTPTPTPIPDLGGTLHGDGNLTAGTEVFSADATNCYTSCSFAWSVDGVAAGTTGDDGDPATFFTAHGQLSHVFGTGTHVVSVTITDGLQRTITLELEVEVAAADLGKPPETDTLDAGSPAPRLPIVVLLVSVGLLLVAAGFGALRRSNPATADQTPRLPE